MVPCMRGASGCSRRFCIPPWLLIKVVDADFLADRKRVFPDVDFDALAVGDLDHHSQVRAYLGAVEAELAHTGQYLAGEQADSWDIHVWGMVWMIYSALPGLVSLKGIRA